LSGVEAALFKAPDPRFKIIYINKNLRPIVLAEP